jgi:hypothetical protein
MPILDPRLGDIEDDASATKKRSLLALGGGLLAEISLPKLAAAWIGLIVLPGLVLGLAPILASIWLGEAFGRAATHQAELWSALALIGLLALSMFSSRRPLRLVESSFWALNALAVQPGYAICREVLRQLVEQRFIRSRRLPRLRSAAALVSGAALCALSLWIFRLVWPATLLDGDLALLAHPELLTRASLANSVALVSLYVAAASMAWAVADAMMDQPQDLESFDAAPEGGKIWRVAHLSDIHAVGETYGFRIESGRAGPRGNDRLRQAFAELRRRHAVDPLHAIVVTGDLTDAGISTEWAELFDLLADYPDLAPLIVATPGNHDLNIVDKANPARLELPGSPHKLLRKLRVISALAAVQGERAQLVDRARRAPGESLAAALAPWRERIAAFADEGRPLLGGELPELWTRIFPLVIAPQGEEGLGFILLNSSADTHFSFTNALGLISSEQAGAVDMLREAFPRARWIVALHHHVIEYPRPAKNLSIRIGTALVNGSWFIRRLGAFGDRAVVLHGHRHVDWIGRCGALRILSAPSPVMEATQDCATCFHIHRFAAGPAGRLLLLAPETVTLSGRPLTSEC